MDRQRRALLKTVGSVSLLTALSAAGLLKSGSVQAAEWNRLAFEAKDLPGALKSLSMENPALSKDLIIKAPEIAENGAFVPVEVVSNLPNTISIAVLADKNPFPLSSAFDFANGALPEISLRIKLGETTLVRAVAKTADGKFYLAQKEIKVTVGGCGG